MTKADSSLKGIPGRFLSLQPAGMFETARSQARQAMQRAHIPNIDALISFEAAARHRSFSRAAAELGLTQGAVSRQIQKLEQQVGVTLFTRVRQRIALTEMGKTYLADVGKILGNLDEATKRLRASADLDMRLTVAVHPTVATFWLIPRLSSFLRDHPQIDFNLKVCTLTRNLSEQYDIAIQHGDREITGFHSEQLLDNRVVPVCSPDFQQLNNISTISDLPRVKLLHQTTRPECWPSWFEQAGIHRLSKAREGIWLERIPMIVQATMGGLGVALLPQFLIERELKSGNLIVLSSHGRIVSKSYFMIQATASSEKNKEFVDWVRHEAKTTSDQAGIGQLLKSAQLTELAD